MRWLITFCGVVGLASNLMAQEKSVLRAGAYAQDVTPKNLPISVNGGFVDRQIKAVDDPLHARCLVLDDGKMQVALVVVDNCLIPRELMDDAKKRAQKATGIDPKNILISATHTHSAPSVTGAFGSAPNKEYVEFLTEKIAEGIAKAQKNLTPARVGFGTIDEPNQVFNRRWKREAALIPADPFGNTTDKVQMNPGHEVKGLLEPAGPTDPQISVLSVQTKDGKPLAILANYGLHYVGGNPNLSADYFGAFADRLSQLIAPEQKSPVFVGIMSNGTSGDVNNINFAKGPLKRGPGEQIRIVADVVAKRVKEVYDKIEHKDNITLAVATKELSLKVRKPTAAEVERAKKILADESIKMGTKEKVYAQETVLLQDYPDEVKLILQAIRIGEVAIGAIPCEVFAEIGLEIKKKSPLKQTFVISLANGYNGYLPTPAQHALGGYETWRARSSYLEVKASEPITAGILELLEKVK